MVKHWIEISLSEKVRWGERRRCTMHGDTGWWVDRLAGGSTVALQRPAASAAGWQPQEAFSSGNQQQEAPLPSWPPVLPDPSKHYFPLLNSLDLHLQLVFHKLHLHVCPLQHVSPGLLVSGRHQSSHFPHKASSQFVLNKINEIKLNIEVNHHNPKLHVWERRQRIESSVKIKEMVAPLNTFSC